LSILNRENRAFNVSLWKFRKKYRLEKVNPELLKRINSLSSLAISMFENSVEALFKHDYNQAESVIEQISQIHKLEKDAVIASQTVNIEAIPNVRLLIESIRRTAEYASDISEVVLNLNVESVLI
jgi:phosphate uptake regulator